LDIKARGYVKTIIKSKLHYFSSVVKQYLKKIYGESAASLHVTDTGITVGFSSAPIRPMIDEGGSRTAKAPDEINNLVDDANERYRKAMDARRVRDGFKK